MEDEIVALTTRLNEINNIVAGHLPAFSQAGGSQQQARVDAAYWVDVLDPLFEEHHSIVERLKELTNR